ncbi:SRPBCC family protein [Saccharothrix sp. Mg75]|uniref:SRPBCC family protein n=1 Tax=Saccharothrix sp. Mg75 TaxID=3445357 RepID=UPI003EEB654A
MPPIFISYRRDDSSGHAGRLYDALAARFGEADVFLDVDSIGPGEDFAEVIERTLARCDALLAVIGRTWASPRLHDPADFVRLEVERALARDLRVVPVLVAGAALPPAGDLPEVLRPLVRRNAFEVSDLRFRRDVDRLAEHLVIASAAGPAAPAVEAFTVERHVRAAPGAVFDLLADPSRAVAVFSSVTRVEPITAGPAGPGTRYRQTSRVLGAEVDSEVSYAEFARPHRLTVVVAEVGSAAPSRIEYAFAPAAGGTRVTCRYLVEGSGWKLRAAVLASRAVGLRGARRELDELAAAAES